MSETTTLETVRATIGYAYAVHCAESHGALYGPGDFQYQPGCRLCDALRHAMQVAAQPVATPATPHRR